MNKEIKFMEQIIADLIKEKRELESRIFILNDKYNNPAWISDRNYLNYEIGHAKTKISYIDYVKSLLEIRIKKLRSKEKNVVEQFTFKP